MDLRMQQIYVAAQRPNGCHVWPLPLERLQSSPALGNKARKDRTHDLVPSPKILGLHLWKPEIGLTQLFEPHLQVVQPMTRWKLSRYESLVCIQVRQRLIAESFSRGRHSSRRRV
jgi:hypothetical protein